MNHAQPQESRLATTRLIDTGWERTRSWLIAYAIVAALLAVVLTLWVVQHPAWDVDLALVRGLQSFRNPTLDAFMRMVGLPGFFPQVIPLNALFIVILFVCRLRREALTLTVLGPLIGISSTLLRYGIDRPRPSPDWVWVGQVIENGHFSFPSGHTFGFLAILGFIAYVGLQRVKPSWHRTVILSLYAAYIVLVGIARTYEGEHWPTDIVGGYLFGSLWLVALILFYHWLGRRGMPGWLKGA